MRLALVGIGSWGQNYIKAIESIPNVTLKYICAQSEKKLSLLPSKYIRLTDYKKLPEYDDIDGIIIATSASTHFEITKFFLAKNYNILVEKPFTTNLKEAKELKRIHKDTVFMVGHIYLYNNAFKEFTKRVEEIGTFNYLDFEFGRYKNDANALFEWGPHGVSMVLELFQQDPIEVSAWGLNVRNLQAENPWDMVYIRLKFRKNKYAFIKTGWLFLENTRKICIVGQNGSIIFDDNVEHKVTLIKGLDISHPFYKDSLPLREEIVEFIRCIEEKKQPKSNIDNGIKVVKILEYINRSINNNGLPISIK